MSTQHLFESIEKGDLAGVRRVLDDDAGLVHVRRTDPHRGEMTTLMVAAQCGALEICRLLVERGAEVYPNAMSVYPPVVEAAWKKQDAVVRYFLDEIPEKARGTNGLGVTIHLAGRMGWKELVARHIERDPLAVFQRGIIGDTPLHWTAHNNFAEIVSMMLDAGAGIEADEIGLYGGKPLHWASEHAPAAVRVLLDRGANVNSRNQQPGIEMEGYTPLMMNARQPEDCAEITEMLIAAGADVAAVDVKGRTALDIAKEKQRPRIQEVLRRLAAT